MTRPLTSHAVRPRVGRRALSASHAVRPRVGRRAPILALVLSALFAAPAPAADPVADALALVPSDPAIVLVLRDLRGHAERLEESPFADWLLKSPRGKAFADSPEAAGVKAAEQFVTGVVGVTPEQIVDDIVGDAVVLTYTAPGTGSGEHSAVYVRPRSMDRLTAVVDKLSKLQTTTGEVLKVESKPHAGGTYTVRTKPGNAADFTAVRDGVFLFTSHEPAAKEFLARATSTELSDRLARLGVSDRMLACVFRPRAFDRELADKLKAITDPKDRAFLAQFGKVWAALDAVAVTAHPDTGLDIGVRVNYRTDALPAELRALLEPARERGPAHPVPAGALAAVRVRARAPALLAAAGSFLPPDDRKQLDKWVADSVGPAVGRDNLAAVLAGFGPELSATVERPAAGSWVPQWTLAARLPDAKTHGPVREAADALAQFVRFEYNRQNPDQLAVTESRRADGTTVRAVAGPGLLPGVAPTYAVAAGHLVVGSTPDRVTAFTAPTSTDSVPLVSVSGVAVRAYLRDHGAKFADWSAARDGKSAADIRKEVAELAEVLEVVDRADIVADTTAGRAGLTLRVTPAKPLRKSVVPASGGR